MHIQLETRDPHTIRSYSETHIMIDTTEYACSVIVNSSSIIPHWPIFQLVELNETNLQPLLDLKPDIIILGSNQPGLAPLPIQLLLSKQRIGLECMSIGAACRTFNLLLSEGRNVAVGIIFTPSPCPEK